MNARKEDGKDYTSFRLGGGVPFPQGKATSGRHRPIPLRWEASGKSERHVIKGRGFFLPQGVHGAPWRAVGGARVAAKQSLIIDQLSDCRRNLARAGQIARRGSLTIWDTRHSFHFKLPSNPALWKWNSFMTTSPFIRDQNLILQVWWGRIWGCGPLLEFDQEE